VALISAGNKSRLIMPLEDAWPLSSPKLEFICGYILDHDETGTDAAASYPPPVQLSHSLGETAYR